MNQKYYKKSQKNNYTNDLYCGTIDEKRSKLTLYIKGVFKNVRCRKRL